MRRLIVKVPLRGVAIVTLLVLYASLIIPFSNYMRRKPFVEKIGLLPRVEVLKLVSADHKQLTGELLILKVLVYFGGLMEKNQVKLDTPPDYQAMSRLIHASVQLDPYNMDAYYFAQSIMVWDVGQIKLANSLLEYGMKYRTWDWTLPYFTGFNYAFFLKDYNKAAQMYMRAGELSGSPISMSLAGRYLQRAGKTEMAISYLSAMEKSARAPALRKTFQTRLQAFRVVLTIEKARDRFKAERGRLPERVDELVAAGYLKQMPVDPYGGSFYLEPDGAVATTSKFAVAGAARSSKKGQ
jgi:hypothetical protein